MLVYYIEVFSFRDFAKISVIGSSFILIKFDSKCDSLSGDRWYVNATASVLMSQVLPHGIVNGAALGYMFFYSGFSY